MTRKKSNVKALALAVTCAILAGGYSGLNPVYAAADTLYKDGTNVTTSNTPSSGSGSNEAIEHLTVGSVTIGGTGGDAGKIIAKNIVGITNVGDTTPSAISINGATFANGGAITAKGLTTDSVNIGGLTISSVASSSTTSAAIDISGTKFESSGVIKANSLSLNGTDVKTAIEAKAAKTDVDTNKNAINTLKQTVGDANSGLVKDVADNETAIQANATAIASKAAQTALDTANGKINTLEGKTTNIFYDASTNTTTVNGIKFHTNNSDGISDINDGIIKFSKNGSKDIVQINSDLMFNDDAGKQAATLTLEGVKTLNGLSNGSSKIEAGNGSVVGGVTFDEKNITDINDATVNNILKVKTIQSLDGNNEITVEEMATTKYNTDKITYDSTDGTTIAGDVMVNKGAQNQVKITNEGVVVGLGSTVIGSDGVYAGGHNYNDAKAAIDGVNGKIKGADGKFGVDDQGNVTTTGNIQGQDITVNGKLNAKGDAVVSGDLSVAGKADFTKKATFSGGIKTDGIYEATADKGVTVDGVLLKDKGIDAADSKFTVNGATGDTTVGGKLDVTGNIQGADITATGALNGDSLNVTKNATVGGTLGVTGDISTDGSVTAKGGLSAANGKFTVDGATGNTAIDGTLKSKGNFSVGDADQFTVDAATGNVVSKGKITSASAKIGAVEIANDGTISGVKAITTDTLTVNNGFITNGNIESKGLKVNGNAEITGTLGVTGAVTGASFNGAAITATTFNGATIDATHFNNVTLSGGNVEANSIKGTTITGTTVTDGAGASMNAGTVKGTTITDGSGFTATGGNVSAKDVTATGTVKGTTVTDGVAKMSGGKVTAQNGVEVDANNYLNSSGLKTSNIDASKATIGKIKIEGSKIASTEADGTVGIAGITVNDAGALNNVNSIDGVAVSGSAASGLTVGTGATAVTIGGNSMALSSTNFGVDNDGDVIGRSFTAGTSYLKDGELKLNDKNIWNTTEGIRAEKATIGANTLNGTGFSTTGTLDVAGKATFGSNAANSTTIEQGAVSVTQNGKTTTIKGGEIETDKLTVNDIVLKNSMKDGTGNTINIKGSDGSMSVASGAFAVDKEGQLTNKITGTAGGFGYETKLETSKSGIKANYTNAINGNQNIIDMGANGISIGVVGTTPSAGAGFKAELDAATMGYGTANSIVVNKDTIKSALGIDVTRVMTNSATDKSIVDKVGTASRSLKADEIVDAAAGMTITTNNTGTTFSNGTNTTLINGSAITSTNGAATGVLTGSNLTLNDGTNSTALTAGGATFTGAAGEKGGTTTTINGGTITTDTLNVERINLGGEVIDKGAAGVEANSKLYMDAQGNFRAAGGNFKVNGADGAMTNTVGNTTLKTDANGAGMSYDNTAATGGVKSNVSVADGKAEMAVGANAAVTATDGKVEIKGGTQNVTTTGAGTVFENSAHNTPFVTGGAANTVINGNEITTGKLTTDQLVITGSGAAAGTGSGTIALGGDGSITSNIKDATTGKEATFKTNAEGTFTEAKDGANVTTNTVNAQGNTNVVTDGTNTSTATQKATSIGGVVTNGTVTMKQELTADGVKFEQTGHDEVNIAKGDVTVKNNRNTATPGQEVHLSDLGSLNNLDGELAARDEYKNNQTAVGGINAEAAIRREEVARLDNRIDDVNNRVDKVGAMAAAIASLKSIGYDPQAPSEFSIGLGQYKGETGVAMGFFHYPNKNFMINVSLSTAGGETMGGIGATWRFGHKSPQKLLDEQREAQARKELAAAEKYQAAAKLAKEAQERAEYAAKLARQAQVSADNAKAAADATQAKHFQ